MKRTHANISKDHSWIEFYRDRLDLLRRRISLLTGKDRVLMTMYVENGNSFRQISKLTGINESNIARRIYKTTKRLLDGYFILCLRNRDRLTSAELKIAKDYFLDGLSMTRISEKRCISYYSVRKAVKKIKASVLQENKKAEHTQ